MTSSFPTRFWSSLVLLNISKLAVFPYLGCVIKMMTKLVLSFVKNYPLSILRHSIQKCVLTNQQTQQIPCSYSMPLRLKIIFLTSKTAKNKKLDEAKRLLKKEMPINYQIFDLIISLGHLDVLINRSHPVYHVYYLIKNKERK